MKYKPLDRYPYMENDLAEREGYVPNEVFALYVERADAEFRDHERRIVRLEDFVDDMPNNYVTRPEYEVYTEATDATLDNHETRITALEETKATKTELQDAVEDLQEQIDTKVDQTEYDSYTEVTDGRLDALEAFKDDVPNTYATKTELNECCNEVKGRLEDLEEFAEDVPNTYTTKNELTTYETATDARLDALEAFKDDVPNTYATKNELTSYETATDARLDALEAFDETVPNIYATKEELNAYKSTNDTRVSEIEGDISDIQETINSLGDTYVTLEEYNQFKSDTEENFENLKPLYVQIKLDNTTESTDRVGYPWKQVFEAPGVTANHYIAFLEQTGNLYGNPFYIETSLDTITFYGVCKPVGSNTYIKLYLKDKEVS